MLALTATATPKVAEDIAARLEFRNGNVFRKSFARDNISYLVRKADTKINDIFHILSRTTGTSIVYVRSRKRCREIAEYLTSCGISATYYHAGLDHALKEERQNAWQADAVRVMVATNAFGMGIDKPDVRIVVHIDPPSSLEEYYQEAGRAGRDGLPSFAVSLVSKSTDKATLTRRLSDSFPRKDYIREVYDKVCVFLNVAMGEGAQTLYEFNMLQFCMRFKLQPVPAENALRLLSQTGCIDYIEETSTRSRLMVIMNRNELYDLTLDEECEQVFQFILRNYTGIFADYEHISEPLIASRVGLTEQTVYDSLLKLTRMHVIHYVPRQTTPYIFYPQARVPSGDLVFPRESYEYRRRQMELRIAAMKEFLFNCEKCRVETLLEYFGEKPTKPCGTCDVCRSTKHTPAKITESPAIPPLTERIAYITRRHPEGISLDPLINELGDNPAKVTEAIRELLDAGQLIITPQRIVFPAGE